MYTLFGTNNKSNKVFLTQNNTVEHTSMLWRYNNCNVGVVEFSKTLFLMITSDKYYPAMAWVVGAQGRVLDKHRANAIWHLMINTANILPADVNVIFFNLKKPSCTST